MVDFDIMVDNEFMQTLIMLFLLSGVLMLIFDVRTYVMADMKKERKAARLLGWTNLILGGLVFVAFHIYNYWWLNS